MSDIKVSILEKDGVEFGGPVEYQLTIFDVLPSDILPISEVWTIPTNKQLILTDYFEIVGELVVGGTLGVV